MEEWIKYNGVEKLPKIEIGNIVRLKLEDGFPYSVSAVVDVVEEHSIEATRKGIGEWGSAIEGFRDDNVVLIKHKVKRVTLSNDYVHAVNRKT